MEVEQVRTQFMESLSRIAEFWGYPRAVGALFGAAYLAPSAVCLDELVEAAGVSKGAVSVHMRTLEQLGMVRREIRLGERKDYYQAETDFWKIVRTILERRQKAEFARALGDVGRALEAVREVRSSDTARLYEERLAAMESFFRTIDGVVATALQVDRLRLDGLKAMLPSTRRKRRKS
jgi:DNA-binding transcriptional regulator GbsR (MarR family)